jgi:hypothetical protein
MHHSLFEPLYQHLASKSPDLVLGPVLRQGKGRRCREYVEVSQKAEFYADFKIILKVAKKFAPRKVQAENFDEQFLKGRKTLYFLNLCLP